MSLHTVLWTSTRGTLASSKSDFPIQNLRLYLKIIILTVIYAKDDGLEWGECGPKYRHTEMKWVLTKGENKAIGHWDKQRKP